MTPRYLLAAILSSLVAVLTPDTLFAQQRCAQPVAIFESVNNSVQLLQASTRAPQPAVRRLAVCPGETIEVGNNSRAVILILASNTPLALDQNSEFVITPAQSGTGSLIELLRGALLFISRVRQSIEIRTPFVNAAIEGTEFVVRVQTDRTLITVFEGAVRATNPLGTIVVGAGQQSVALKGQAPVLEIPIRPRDAVQWALHYEPLLPSDSLQQLADIPEAQRDATFFLRRAAVQLGTGQVAAAQSDLELAQKLDPSLGDAYALRTIIAVALNDADAALTHGRAAVERSPRSAAAQVALSYALQANFRLDEALHSVTQAVQAEPGNALAWARLAELQLAVGDIGQGVEASQRAAQLAPLMSRAQSVLGFAALARLDLSEAAAAFERAIDLAPDTPLPRLGLGLTKIRRGRLVDGRRDIELAAALNPESSLIRSYLGKAYFDERRDVLAGESFDLAKTLGPLDSTPWLYDAVRKQTLNRPIEALADLRRSIELNGNRAVYRSKFLLDADVAARGAGLGWIYRDLGFEQLALVEATKSLAVDPSDHSAHMFLADSYLTFPRHEIARDSELLQSQLLQPVNVNPVQPRLADNGVVFLDELGSSTIGFNEFTRLFTADQVRLVADGIVGNMGTRADNVIVAGVLRKFSYSVGQFHFSTDGFRPNNAIRQNIYHGFLQADLTSRTSAQFEVRGADLAAGDRLVLFDSSSFLPQRRSSDDASSLRLGMRHRLSRRALVIASYAHRKHDGMLTIGPTFDLTSDDDADLAEARYLQTWGRLNLTAGGGYFAGTEHDRTTFLGRTNESEPSRVRHANGYAYAGVTVAPNLIVLAGASVDGFDSSGLTRRQVNPKVGVTWNLSSRTTLRAAVFRALRRSLIASQTIEPSQVMGFNQFYDDLDGTKSRRYGVAVDHAFSRQVYAGAEWSGRQLTAPVIAEDTRRVTDDEATERFGRAYVYFAAARYLAIATEYHMEGLTRDPFGANEASLAESTTHRLSTAVRLFHPSGWVGQARLGFVDHSGLFAAEAFTVSPGADRFAFLDVSAGYRLPSRRGMVTFEIRNVLNSRFSYQDSAPETPRLLPRRSATLRLTLSL